MPMKIVQNRMFSLTTLPLGVQPPFWDGKVLRGHLWLSVEAG
jgi:hypothetical protein